MLLASGVQRLVQCVEAANSADQVAHDNWTPEQGAKLKPEESSKASPYILLARPSFYVWELALKRILDHENPFDAKVVEAAPFLEMLQIVYFADLVVPVEQDASYQDSLGPNLAVDPFHACIDPCPAQHPALFAPNPWLAVAASRCWYWPLSPFLFDVHETLLRRLRSLHAFRQPIWKPDECL